MLTGQVLPIRAVSHSGKKARDGHEWRCSCGEWNFFTGSSSRRLAEADLDSHLLTHARDDTLPTKALFYTSEGIGPRIQPGDRVRHAHLDRDEVGTVIDTKLIGNNEIPVHWPKLGRAGADPKFLTLIHPGEQSTPNDLGRSDACSSAPDVDFDTNDIQVDEGSPEHAQTKRHTLLARLEFDEAPEINNHMQYLKSRWDVFTDNELINLNQSLVQSQCYCSDHKQLRTETCEELKNRLIPVAGNCK